MRRHRQRRMVGYVVGVDLLHWEHCHQQQWSQDSLLGDLSAKQARFSQVTIWSLMAGADRRQDVTPGHSPKMTWDLQGDGSQDPRGCQNRAQEALGGLQGGHMMVREVSERTSAFTWPKASFSTPPASILYPIYVLLASI